MVEWFLAVLINGVYTPTQSFPTAELCNKARAEIIEHWPDKKETVHCRVRMTIK
jgi:predicted lipoprotein